MAVTTAHVSAGEYFNTGYSSDCDYVDGVAGNSETEVKDEILRAGEFELGLTD